MTAALQASQWRAAAYVFTLGRPVLAAALWLRPLDLGYVLILTAAAAVSDLLDGWAARKHLAVLASAGIPTVPPSTGAWLDPLCDKVFVLSVLGVAWLTARPPISIVALIAAREIIQVPLAAVYAVMHALGWRAGFDFTAGFWGKMATIAQFAAIFWLLLLPSLSCRWPAGIAGVLGVIAAVGYVRRAVVSG